MNFKIQALEKALDQTPLQTGNESFSGNGHTVIFEDVRFSYHDNEVLKGISFTASEGHMTALVGESGSGKSTLLNVISGLDSYEEGEMYIFDQPTSGYGKEEMEAYRKKYNVE